MTDTRPPDTTAPALVCLDDYERQAQRRLDPASWAFFSGGAADGISLKRNRQAWQDLTLLPRVLQPLGEGHTRIELLGRSRAHPILLAPVAHQRLAHPDGELASAWAASAMEAGMVLSMQSNTPLEDVAQAYGPQPSLGGLWFQLYMQNDRGLTQSLIQRAEQAGYEALVVTVDAPVSGVRDQERRSGWRLPPGLQAVHLPPKDLGAQPWPHAPGQTWCQGLLQQAPTWDDIAWLQSQTRLPILLKGILHPADARQAARLAVAGVIVSNHGGRALDTSPASAAMLPRVCEAVRGEVDVLVDGGIRRGTDVLKAMALGAQAVLIGRPVVFGLSCAGAHGVAHVLRLLRDELEIAMALCGCRDLTALPSDLLLP